MVSSQGLNCSWSSLDHFTVNLALGLPLITSLLTPAFASLPEQPQALSRAWHAQAAPCGRRHILRAAPLWRHVLLRVDLRRDGGPPSGAHLLAGVHAPSLIGCCWPSLIACCCPLPHCMRAHLLAAVPHAHAHGPTHTHMAPRTRTRHDHPATCRARLTMPTPVCFVSWPYQSIGRRRHRRCQRIRLRRRPLSQLLLACCR